MYTPKRFKGKDGQHAIEFMKRFNFGVLISVEDEKPIGTHLPFLIGEYEGELVITGHMAAANSQLNTLADQEALIIFSEPHAYVSPSFYSTQENVPTWNYLSVHAYGKVQILNSYEDKIEVLEQSMASFESEYLKQWKELGQAYKTRLAKGMVAFKIQVTELQYKEKLSQNRKEEERKRIIDAFSKSSDENERIVSGFMAENEVLRSNSNQE